jgi:C-terminal processing protease CtpA/Prc
MDMRGYALATPKIEMLKDGIGYISIPGYFGTEKKANDAFIAEITTPISALASGVEHGWIVDLRENVGGNMWPMLGGLRPFLGNEDLGYFESASGRGPPWRAPGSSDQQPGPDLTRAFVAVLTGARTASSGEAVAIAFRGRARTRSFGLPTAGLTSANMAFDLPDASRIMLTTAIDVDRDGKRYEGPLVPDEVVRSDGEGAIDVVLAAARSWLMTVHDRSRH